MSWWVQNEVEALLQQLSSRVHVIEQKLNDRVDARNLDDLEQLVKELDYVSACFEEDLGDDAEDDVVNHELVDQTDNEWWQMVHDIKQIGAKVHYLSLEDGTISRSFDQVVTRFDHKAKVLSGDITQLQISAAGILSGLRRHDADRNGGVARIVWRCGHCISSGASKKDSKTANAEKSRAKLQRKRLSISGFARNSYLPNPDISESRNDQSHMISDSAHEARPCPLGCYDESGASISKDPQTWMQDRRYMATLPTQRDGVCHGSQGRNSRGQ